VRLRTFIRAPNARMLIDIDTETLLDLPAACRHPALVNSRTHRPCHLAQIYRYVQRGAVAANGERVRLETVRTPAGMRTSREAIGRFIAELTDPDRPAPAPWVRRKQMAVAKAELEAAGFEIGTNPTELVTA